MSKSDFVYVTYIETTPEKLWQALTSSEFTRNYWFGYDVESDWTKGATYKFTKPGVPAIEGEVLEADPMRRLIYTWTSCSQDVSEPPSRVTFDIERLGKAVKLVVTHDRLIEGSPTIQQVSQGWSIVLSNLKSLLEVGHALIDHPPGAAPAQTHAA